MPEWATYTKKDPRSRKNEAQSKEKAPREFPREASTSEYFQSSGDDMSPSFVINESVHQSQMRNVDEERMSVEERVDRACGLQEKNPLNFLLTFTSSFDESSRTEM